MLSQNICLFTGHIGSVSTMKIPSGTTKTTVRLALTENYKDKTSGQWQKKTDWATIVFWGRAAERLNEKNPGPGDVLQLLDAKFKTRSWEDKQTAQKRSSAEFVANSFNHTPKANLAGRDAAETPATDANDYSQDGDDEFASVGYAVADPDSVPF